jgi:very-short-patch-repair endonuclease
MADSGLQQAFQALKNRDPAKVGKKIVAPHPDYKRIPQHNYAPTTAVETGGWGTGMSRTAATSAGIVYGQPQFFSPVHTPINWQIPSKRLEQYQWARFFYENEPKVAAAVDFYSDFPMSDFEHECRNRDVKIHFDKLKDKIELPKWCRLISHEVHLLGDCFPFIEIDCPHCFGAGKVGDEICEHEGGTVRRVVLLNPDYVEVHTTSINPDPMIALRPDEELINMVQRKIPGYEKLSPEVVALIATGQPIRLDNRNVSHLKYGECGYQKFGIGMVRRLFPILSYKTKLMVAQWIVAERLIVPIKIVKVGSDERPAGPADIADVQSQLSQTANDPNLTIVTHHAFELDFVGAAGRVLTLSNEFEFINQEILDGMMINNALLNGEGPNFSSAAVGIEAMIQRLNTFRSEVARWIEKNIYLPEAKRQGFVDKNPDTGEDEYIIPKIKWASMHLRDQQQYRTFIIQLYDKGLLSAQTVLEAFDLDPDQEIERKRYDALQFMAIGQGFGPSAPGGAGGGGFGAGGSAMPPLDGGGGLGGEPPIGAPGEMGGPGTPVGGGGMPSPVGGGVGGPMPKSTSITAEVADPTQFGGKVLKKRTRERIQSEQEKIFREQETQGVMGKDEQGYFRDEKGRIAFTKAERDLIPKLMQAQQDGLLKETIYPQYRVNAAGQEYSLDFGIPELKIGIEADGEVFHGSREQVDRDNARDMKLQQQGWTILRFTDTEIERSGPQIVRTVLQEIMRKRMWLEQNAQDLQAKPSLTAPNTT